MTRVLTLLVFGFLSLAQLSAQVVEKPYFQVFDINDDVKNIKVETADSFTIRKWNGVQLMVDMSIRLEGGSMDLLGVVIFDNRYAYDIDNQGAMLIVRPKIAHRESNRIKYKGSYCTEKITMTIYVPDGFEVHNGNEFIRKEDVIIASDKH